MASGLSTPVKPEALAAIVVVAVAAILALLLGIERESPTAAAYVPPAATSSTPPASAPASVPASTPGSESASSPAEDPTGFPASAKYTGTVRNSAASIAIIVKERRAVAYFCDGVREFWLTGTVERGELKARGKNGQRLEGELSGRTITGELKDGENEFAYSARLTKPPGGVFTSTFAAGTARLTWIVRGDGGQTGLQVSDEGAEAAPALTPGATSITIDGETVPVEAATEPPG